MVEGILTEKQAGYEDLITRFDPRVITRGIVARKLPARYHSWPPSSAFTVARNEKCTKIREEEVLVIVHGLERARQKSGEEDDGKAGVKKGDANTENGEKGWFAEWFQVGYTGWRVCNHLWERGEYRSAQYLSVLILFLRV